MYGVCVSVLDVFKFFFELSRERVARVFGRRRAFRVVLMCCCLCVCVWYLNVFCCIYFVKVKVCVWVLLGIVVFSVCVRDRVIRLRRSEIRDRD